MTVQQAITWALVAAACLITLAIFLNRLARSMKAGEPPRPEPGTWVRALLENAPVGEFAPPADAFDPTVEGLLVGYDGNTALVRDSLHDGTTHHCLAFGIVPLPDPSLRIHRAWVAEFRSAQEAETGPWKH